MADRAEGRLELRSLLAAVEVAPPVAAVDVFAAELGKRLAAQEVAFLIADSSGNAIVRMSHDGGGQGRRSQGRDAAETVPLAGTPYEQVLRTQRLQVLPAGELARVLAPVTDRGDVIGVLEMLLPADPDPDTVDYIAATADVFGLLAATGDLHPREVVQEITRAVLRAVGGTLRDDATVLCLDWYGGGERDRQADAGANQHGTSPPRPAS